MEPDYIALVEGCRRHDRRAQRVLYDALAPMAMGVCMRYAHNRDEAQDLLQEGFIKVFENLRRLRDPRKVGSWAYRLMVNTCINHYKGMVKPLSLDDLDYEPESFPMDPFGAEEMVAAMQSLTPQQRLVFNLVQVEGYDYDEVARELHCAPSTVRTLISKARRRLKEILI